MAFQAEAGGEALVLSSCHLRPVRTKSISCVERPLVRTGQEVGIQCGAHGAGVCEGKGERGTEGRGERVWGSVGAYVADAAGCVGGDSGPQSYIAVFIEKSCFVGFFVANPVYIPE